MKRNLPDVVTKKLIPAIGSLRRSWRNESFSTRAAKQADLAATRDDHNPVEGRPVKTRCHLYLSEARSWSNYWGPLQTRADPFEEDWPTVLEWLEAAPDSTAKSLFERLMSEQPGKYKTSQLRTLQRRVRQWRKLMAKQLVYDCLPDEVEAKAIRPRD